MTDRRLLHPCDALRAAIDRLRDCTPTRGEPPDAMRRELLATAAGDVERALCQVLRCVRELEQDGHAALERAATVVGNPGAPALAPGEAREVWRRLCREATDAWVRDQPPARE